MMRIKDKKILMLLIGNIKYDGRVQKEIYSLKSLGFEVELVTNELDINDSIENYNFPVKVIIKKRGGNLFKQVYNNIVYYFKLRRQIKHSDAMYLHCHDVNALIYSFCLNKRKKLVYDSHELVIGNFEGLRLRILKLAESFFLKRCYKIIHTQIDRLNIFYFYYKSKINYKDLVLIENWPLNVGNLSTSYFKDNYFFEGNEKIISYNGFIGIERNLEPIIRAMVSLQDAVFFIIGKGDDSYIRYLKSLVVELNLEERVYIKGPVVNSDVLHIANSSDLAVCFYSEPKLNSYFCASNKIYEYLNCGVKVLTNDIGGVARVIQPGINGYCVKDITEESIAFGLRSLLDNDINFKSNFYWDNQIEKFKEIYL